MKMTAALIKKMIRLANGESLPASSLKGETVEQMLSEGILITTARGSRKSYRARDEQSLRAFGATYLGIDNLEDCLDMLTEEDASKARQVQVAGNSKIRHHRSFRGFLINCYEPVNAMLADRSVTIYPEEGTFVFIYDFKEFSIPRDIVIVGIENAENFRYIREQKWLFESVFPKGSKLLFVSRYPQEQSADLLEWLVSIPNRYIHFGDLDLAGIHIYLTEYYRHLGDKASFLIPEDFEDRISHGSGSRYDNQYEKFGKMEVPDIRLHPLIDCIHKLHKGYDQEGFITGGTNSNNQI